MQGPQCAADLRLFVQSQYDDAYQAIVGRNLNRHLLILFAKAPLAVRVRIIELSSGAPIEPWPGVTVAVTLEFLGSRSLRLKVQLEAQLSAFKLATGRTWFNQGWERKLQMPANTSSRSMNYRKIQTGARR